MEKLLVKKIFICLTITIVFPLIAASPKYIFLFIGDGMGVPQIALASEYAKGNLALNTLPVVGITTTRSLNHFITDSAAAGTALASGEKTNSGMIGMTPDGKILEACTVNAAHHNKKIGIVTSVSLDHATPAAFYAHVSNRNHYYDIACQMAKSNIDYLAGGGLLQPQGEDGKLPDALALAQQNNYIISRTLKEFNELKPGQKAIALAPNPTNQASLQYEIDQKYSPNQISLADFTRKGIELLQNPNGFFLMVEGGMIDWACHANDAATAVHEILAFDQAIQVALKFAEKHPVETLIIVTADHETGGLALGHGQIPYQNDYSLLEKQQCSFQQFATLVNKLKISGLSFEKSCKLVEENYGLDCGKLTSLELCRLKFAWKVSIGELAISPQMQNELYGDNEPICAVVNRILSTKAGLGWSTWAHSALPVITGASGAKSEIFAGRNDNTDIARIIHEMLVDSANKNDNLSLQ